MHQTDALLAKLLECGALANIPHFSCTHYPQVPGNRYGQANFEFADFGPRHAAIRFIFRSNGDVLFSGSPTQWSPCVGSDIFRGYSAPATVDLLAFSIDSIILIKKTVDLYTRTIPYEDYSVLLGLWSHTNPELFDKPTEAHFGAPWWKIW